jgi:hypothetical protein
MKKPAGKPIVLESPDLVAFITFHQRINPRPFKRESDKKVCFEFSEDVSDSIAAFYRNIPIPISDFCKNLKQVRSMIFNLKAGS